MKDNNKTKVNKVAFVVGGNGGVACRVSIPKSFLDEINITKEEPFLEIKMLENAILLFKPTKTE